MSSGVWFIIWDGLRAMLGATGRWCLWSLAMAAVLVAGTAVVILPGQEESRGPQTHLFVLAYLEQALSEADVNRLAWETWRWPEVTQQGFRFPGETDPKDIQRRALVLQVEDEATRVEVEDRLHATDGVAGVEQLRQTVAPPPQLPAASRLGALIGLVLALASSVLVARWAMGAMAARWQSELSLLRQSGLRESVLRIPFLAAGGVAGLAAASLYLACYWSVWAWSQGVPDVLHAAPALATGGPMATGMGMVVALLLGMLGAALAYPPRRPTP
ncbi:MAG: hypothetical protein R6U88_04745 [Candidatus Bipolaricaulota bacterium]